MAIVEVSEGTAVARPARFSYLEWGPVIAGALGAAAISLVLFTFGSALGLSAVSPYPYAGLSLNAFLILAALFAALVQVGSFAAGGYLAGRMRSPWLSGVESERQFRDGSHGFAVWAVGILIGACIAISGAGSALKTAVQTTATLSAGAIAGGGAAMGPTVADRVSMQPSDIAIDLLLRPAPGQMAARPAAAVTGSPMADGVRLEVRGVPRQELQAPMTRVFGTSLASGTMIPADRAYLAEVVSRQTGLPQPEAEKRVDEAYAAAKDAEAKARAAAEKARKLSAIAAFLAGATLLIACAAACAGAGLGGRHRDEKIAARLFGTRRFW